MESKMPPPGRTPRTLLHNEILGEGRLKTAFCLKCIFRLPVCWIFFNEYTFFSGGGEWLFCLLKAMLYTIYYIRYMLYTECCLCSHCNIDINIDFESRLCRFSLYKCLSHSKHVLRMIIGNNMIVST